MTKQYDVGRKLVAGHLKVRRMKVGEVARQLGRSKGGVGGSRAGHRWTSKEAREAGMKGRKKRDGRTSKRTGAKVGGLVRQRTTVNHAELRAQYALVPGWAGENQIWFNRVLGQWFTDDLATGSHVISERQALTRLGHLKSRTKGFVPDSAGTGVAPQEGV